MRQRAELVIETDADEETLRRVVATETGRTFESVREVDILYQTEQDGLDESYIGVFQLHGVEAADSNDTGSLSLWPILAIFCLILGAVSLRQERYPISALLFTVGAVSYRNYRRAQEGAQ